MCLCVCMCVFSVVCYLSPQTVITLQSDIDRLTFISVMQLNVQTQTAHQ